MCKFIIIIIIAIEYEQQRTAESASRKRMISTFWVFLESQSFMTT